MSLSYDIAVIGGGIVGGMLTRQLSAIYPTKKIALIEKEDGVIIFVSLS